jgi:hypothetical protein
MSCTTEAVAGGTQEEMSLDVEDIANSGVDGDEALGRAGRFEGLHLALSSPHEDLHAVAAKLSLQEHRPICVRCGKGRLVLIDERPDPNFGILGLLQQTLECDSPECGKVTIV